MKNPKYFNNKIIFLLVLLNGLFFRPSHSLSQEFSSCFIIYSNGRVVDLNSTAICPVDKKRKNKSSINSESNICKKIDQNLEKEYCRIALNTVNEEELARAVEVSVSTDSINYSDICQKKVAVELKEPSKIHFLGKVKPHQIFSGVYVISGRVYSQNLNNDLNRHSYVCVFSNSPEPQQLNKVSVKPLLLK